MYIYRTLIVLCVLIQTLFVFLHFTQATDQTFLNKANGVAWRCSVSWVTGRVTWDGWDVPGANQVETTQLASFIIFPFGGRVPIRHDDPMWSRTKLVSLSHSLAASTVETETSGNSSTKLWRSLRRTRSMQGAMFFFCWAAFVDEVRLTHRFIQHFSCIFMYVIDCYTMITVNYIYIRQSWKLKSQGSSIERLIENVICLFHFGSLGSPWTPPPGWSCPRSRAVASLGSGTLQEMCAPPGSGTPWWPAEYEKTWENHRKTPSESIWMLNRRNL